MNYTTHQKVTLNNASQHIPIFIKNSKSTKQFMRKKLHDIAEISVHHPFDI